MKNFDQWARELADKVSEQCRIEPCRGHAMADPMDGCTEADESAMVTTFDVSDGSFAHRLANWPRIKPEGTGDVYWFGEDGRRRRVGTVECENEAAMAALAVGSVVVDIEFRVWEKSESGQWKVSGRPLPW